MLDILVKLQPAIIYGRTKAVEITANGAAHPIDPVSLEVDSKVTASDCVVLRHKKDAVGINIKYMQEDNRGYCQFQFYHNNIIVVIAKVALKKQKNLSTGSLKLECSMYALKTYMI